MAQMASGISASGWKVTKIRNPSAISLGDGLATLLQNNLPSCQIAIGVVDGDYSNGASSTNGVVFAFIWNGASNGKNYFRTVNGVFDASSIRPMTSTYACIVPENTVFTVLYVEALAQ